MSQRSATWFTSCCCRASGYSADQQFAGERKHNNAPMQWEVILLASKHTCRQSSRSYLNTYFANMRWRKKSEHCVQSFHTALEKVSLWLVRRGGIMKMNFNWLYNLNLSFEGLKHVCPNCTTPSVKPLYWEKTEKPSILLKVNRYFVRATPSTHS